MKLKLMNLVAAALSLTALASCKKEFKLTDSGNLVPKTVDQDPSLPAISVNGTMFHSETFGNPDSAMIIILHGGPGADYRSILNCKDFANDGYFVVFYDQRGSGLSQRHEENTYGVQLMLDDLSAVIQHYRKSPQQKVFLFGHSWGAMLATAYINAYPTAVSGVILAEPGGFTWSDTEGYIGRTKKINPTSEPTNDILYLDQFITGKESEQEILDYKMILNSAYDFAKDNPIGNAGPVPFWRYGAVVQSSLFAIASTDGFDWTTHLNQFTTKVLFFYSELNTAYGYEYAQKVSSPYNNVQLEKINGSGHEMIYFGWNTLHPLALTYLNSLK